MPTRKAEPTTWRRRQQHTLLTLACLHALSSKLKPQDTAALRNREGGTLMERVLSTSAWNAALPRALADLLLYAPFSGSFMACALSSTFPAGASVKVPAHAQHGNQRLLSQNYPQAS